MRYIHAAAARHGSKPRFAVSNAFCIQLTSRRIWSTTARRSTTTGPTDLFSAALEEASTRPDGRFPTDGGYTGATRDTAAIDRVRKNGRAVGYRAVTVRSGLRDIFLRILRSRPTPLDSGTLGLPGELYRSLFPAYRFRSSSGGNSRPRPDRSSRALPHGAAAISVWPVGSDRSDAIRAGLARIANQAPASRSRHCPAGPPQRSMRSAATDPRRRKATGGGRCSGRVVMFN
jgi:hypothetical protein